MHGRVQRQQEEGERGAEHLQRQDGVGDAVVERGDAHRLLVDHLVQGLDIQARRAISWRGYERVPGQRPELALESVFLGDRACEPGGGRDRIRERQAGVRVLPEQLERAASHRLGQGLRAQVRGPDRVGVVDDCGPARVVAPDRKRQAEGEDQPDQREERALHDSDRLAQRVGLQAQHAAGQVPEGDESEDDAGDDQPELPGA